MNTLELVDNIRSGHDARRAEEQLYTKVQGELLPRIQRRITGRVRSRLDPEDVLHEAFLRAMGALDLFQLRSESAFYAWVYRIARNLLVDQAKRRSVDAVHLAAGENERGPRASQVKALQRRPESLLQGRDLIEFLLGRLEARDAELIRQHKLEEQSFAQIAKKYDKTPSAVQRSYSRAWRRLCALAGREPG